MATGFQSLIALQSFVISPAHPSPPRGNYDQRQPRLAQRPKTLAACCLLVAYLP